MGFNKHQEQERQVSSFEHIRNGFGCLIELARADALYGVTPNQIEALHTLKQSYNLPYSESDLREIVKVLSGNNFLQPVLHARDEVITQEIIATVKAGIEMILGGNGNVENPLELVVTPYPKSTLLSNMLSELGKFGLSSKYDRNVRTLYSHPDVARKIPVRNGKEDVTRREYEEDKSYFPKGLPISSNPEEHLRILDETVESILSLFTKGGILISNWNEGYILDYTLFQEHQAETRILGTNAPLRV